MEREFYEQSPLNKKKFSKHFLFYKTKKWLKIKQIFPF